MDLNCDKCGKLIKHGDAYVTITREIECFEYDIHECHEVVNVIDAEELITFCLNYGNIFNSIMIKQIIDSI